MKVTVKREHGNAGDVLVSLDGGDPLRVPGTVSVYMVFMMLGPWLEAQLTDTSPPPETQPEIPAAKRVDEGWT
jgi:hypothetical protein